MSFNLYDKKVLSFFIFLLMQKVLLLVTFDNISQFHW